MKTSKAGIDFICAQEGFRATVYNDVAGYPTIGFGHLIKPGEVFGALSSVEATALMMKDLIPFEDCVNKHIKVVLKQNQFDALVSFTYNVGQTNFTTSTLLKLLNAGFTAQAAREFPKWHRAGGKEINGLLIRRNKEMAMFLGEPNEAV